MAWKGTSGIFGLLTGSFLVALNQFPALLGEHGLLPVQEFVKGAPFAQSPSLFYLGYSDRLFTLATWSGIILAVLVLSGALGTAPWWFSSAIWLALFVLYLSIVNVGQTFYAFGWELMLVEAGSGRHKTVLDPGSGSPVDTIPPHAGRRVDQAAE